MTAPTCYVITARDFQALIDAVLLIPLIVLVVNAIFRDWFRYEDRIRRFLRRRRIRAIRQARQVQA